MKRYFGLILILLVLVLPVDAFAAQMINEDYYRVYDTSGDISEMQRDDLDSRCFEFAEKYETDLLVISITEDEYPGESLREIAESYYEDDVFGYGEDRSCIIMVCDVSTGEMEFVTFGNAADLIPQSYYDFIKERVFEYKEEYGVFGVLYSTQGFLFNYLEDDDPDTASDFPEKVGDAGAGERPYWYVKDLDNFELFHDEDAARVVDDAGIFSDEEIAGMTKRLWEIKDEIGKDIVIFTDTSTYGLSRKVYAADYFEMNGYGTGDEYEGVVLFVCMDPSDRGWWAACSGSQTMGLYTEEIANAIDDELYEYMSKGSYAEGISGWIENFRLLYLNGNPFAPDWLLGGGKESGTQTPQVNDEAHYLNDEEKAALTEHAARLSDEYDLDVMIYTVPVAAAAGFGIDEFAEKYYECNDIGRGEDKDGIVLVIYKNEEQDASLAWLYASGKGLDKLSDVNRARLLGNLRFHVGSEGDKNYEGMDRYLDELGDMYKKGLVGRSLWYWLPVMLLGIVSGSIFGGVLLYIAKMKMDIPASEPDADLYIVAGSVNVAGRDVFVTSDTSRVYAPVEEGSSSSSSGSSGRSSYSSGYSSSSGHTHSGSGRNF